MLSVFKRKLMPSALLAIMSFGLVACTASLPRKANAPRPAEEIGIADFSALYNNSSVSQSVFPLGDATLLYKETMARVLVSPNVFLEASRNSGVEPNTVGPVGAQWPEPNLPDALGMPIAISLSSLLLEYMAKKGSVLITPAILSSWKCDEASKNCSNRTWLERVLAAPQENDSDNALPTVAFAVRELGISFRNVDVVATREKGDNIIFRPRRSIDEDSACGDMTLLVPTLVFSGEVVSRQDGRLIARIHVEKVPEVDVAQHASIDLVQWKPTNRFAYLKSQRGEPIPSSLYTYVKKWRQQPVYCKEAVRVYKKVLRDVEQSMRLHLSETVASMLPQALGRLYGRSVPTPSWTKDGAE